MNETEIIEVFNILHKKKSNWITPVVTRVALEKRDPFKILITTILSLRTKDQVTNDASERLFRNLSTPEELSKVSPENLEKIIFPVGFYKKKARTIIEISRSIIENYNSKVPDNLDSLLTLKGVGRKTANLVLTEAFGKPGICVDTHVHRISNRLGYISTKSPHETEYELRRKLPVQLWKDYNEVLVAFGQNVCKPVSPYCSLCPVQDYCIRQGVTYSR